MWKNINKSSGQIARVLLALAVLVLVAMGIAYIVVSRTRPVVVPVDDIPDVPLPVYETTIGDVRFVFLEATDKGSTLTGAKSNNPEWQKDVKTTERFIELIVGAQNVGKVNTERRVWDIGEIVDSEGRNFIPTTQDVRTWLPQEELCGAVLAPSFEPIPCTKIYEVAKVSKDLKVKVFVYKNGSSVDRDEALIDIKLMP